MRFEINFRYPAARPLNWNRSTRLQYEYTCINHKLMFDCPTLRLRPYVMWRINTNRLGRISELMLTGECVELITRFYV